MKRTIIFLYALLIGISGAWAQLSSNTITKSGSVTDSWNIKSSLLTNNWTAMGDATPTGVTALGSYTAYCRTQDITLSNDGALFITFLYSKGNDRLDILGVDLLNKNNEVVRSDYHYGYTGTALSHNVYMLDHITSGNYKIRFIINSGVSNSEGNITVKHINIKTASSFENITNWYFVRMHSNLTHYMYYDKSESGITFSSSKQNNAHYLWGFVKDTDGIKIYNKAAGSSVSIDNGNPCKLSASGQTFTFGSGRVGNNGAAAGAYFSLYKNPDRSATARSYLNYQSDNIARWSSDDEGSAWMIDETDISAPFVSASEGKVYKIQAYFSNSDNLYFTNNGTNLAFNTSASSGVNDYWILRSSGNGNYPWRFESGRGDGKFLSSTDGLANTGVYLQINNIDSYFNLRGSKDGNAKTSGIVNLATWSGANNKSGFGAYGTGGCWSSDGNNDSGWSTKYTIEEVTGVDIYTVVSNINAGGVTYKSSYTGKAEQTNGGFYILASAPSATDFTALTISDYTAGEVVVDATAKTITVNYTANIKYTLTDVNGANYSWSTSGAFGTAPTLTGCAGLTVSNEVWNEEARTYTADITFPFPVSSNSVTNWTYIRQYATSYVNAKFYWYSKEDKVYVEKGVYPTNGNNTNYEWSIIPSCSNGAFTFTIKNNAKNTYVTYNTSQTNAHSNAITLSESGTSLEYVYEEPYHRWAIPSSNQRLSINSSGDNKGEQELGTYANHSGTAIEFEDPEDFATLLTNLKTARNKFIAYLLYFSNGTYTETVEGTMMTTNNQQATDRNVVKDTPTAYFTAAQFNTYTDNYNNAVAGLRYVMPTFFRVKNLDGSKYVKERSTIDYANYYQLEFSADGTDAKSIFYLNASNSIISYYSGSYLFSINHTKPVSYDEAYYQCTYEFLPGSDVNRVYVHVANNPSGWGGSEKYWIATDTNVGRGTAPTADSDFLIEAVTSLPVTISAARYATFNSPVAVEIPEGVTAYVATDKGEYLTLTAIEGGVIPANTGVILKGEAGTYNFDITTGGSEKDNVLTGTVAAIARPTGSYILSTGSNDVGFYGDGASTIPGFKSYLQTAESIRGFLGFNFDDPTAITTVEAAMNAGKAIYDLSGRRVENPVSGLYIVNGKKVFINKK